MFLRLRWKFPPSLKFTTCDQRCLVIALLLLIRYVTLWPWLLTLWSWSVVIHGGIRDQPLQVWRSYGYPFLSYEFWHLPLSWQCICSHCVEIPDLKLPIHYTSFMALRLRQMQLSAKTGYNPVLKTKLECGSMPNVMAALPNIGGALCSTPQSLVHARYQTDVQ